MAITSGLPGIGVGLGVSASGVASGLRAAERQSVGGDAQFCMVTLLQRNSF